MTRILGGLRGLATGLLLVFLSSRAAAQEPQETARIGLAEAQRLAQDRAPDVLLSNARAETVRADVNVAGMYPNPRITVGTTSGTAVVYGNLFIALPLFGQVGTAVDAADAQARVAEAGLEVSRLDARLAVSMAWWALWQANGELRIALDNAARRQRLLDTAQARFSEGAAPRLDVLRAQTEVRRAHGEAAALIEQRVGAVARLAVLLGGTDHGLPDVTGDPNLGPLLLTDTQVESLLADHPLVRRARQLLHAADAVVTREHRARWPLVGVQVGGSFFERQPPPAHDVSVGITVEIPLFNGPLVARAETARRAATTEFETVVVQLRARLLGARADYLSALRRHEAIVNDVLPAAQEAADLAAEAYQSGGLDLTGTLAAEQTRADTLLAVVRATTERGRALASLEHASGRAL